MRNQFYPVFGEESQQSFQHAAHNHRSDEGAHAIGCANADGQREKGEGNTHHDGQSRTYSPYGVELHQRTYTRYYHTVLYEHRTD